MSASCQKGLELNNWDDDGYVYFISCVITALRLLERQSLGLCLVIKGAYGVVVRGECTDRVITSVTVIMTDAHIGPTTSSSHHWLLMSNWGVGLEHPCIRINTPQWEELSRLEAQAPKRSGVLY